MSTACNITSLHSLLADFATIPEEYECNIGGITLDSRHVREDDLFIATIGTQEDGRKYIEQAVTQGAVAIVTEGDTNLSAILEVKQQENRSVPIIAINNLKPKIGAIAAKFYGYPSQHLTVIGVTGTNGKTSVTQFLARALQAAGTSCAVIGTIGNGFPDHLSVSNLTTPDPITLQKIMAHYLIQGAQAIAMEVSSHSLAQERVNGVNFNTAIFTNLTRDHLDYHGTIENYAAAKLRLFQQPGLKNAIINLDDPYAPLFLEQMPKNIMVYGYAMGDTKNFPNLPIVRVTQVELTSHDFNATVESPWGNGQLKSHLLGRFNISNLLAVLTALCLLEIPFADALQYLAVMPTVPGRMQTFGGAKLPTIVVDYAHTPDALAQALTALREHCQGRLWCVFGCGGDRDKGKRPLMAQIAERYSDNIIITDDNPRTEGSAVIISDIEKGLLCPWAAEIIPDRHDAIAHAINSAQSGDVVLIAGKGHEPYQIVGTEKLSFSDAEEVQAQLRLKK